MTINIDWSVSGANTGDVELILTSIPNITIGENIDAGTHAETIMTDITTIAAPSDGIMQRSTFLLPEPTALADDDVILQISRDARNSNPNDTLAGSIKIFNMEIEAVRYAYIIDYNTSS